VVAGTAVAATIVPSAASASPTVLTIKVGGDTQVSHVTFEGMRFDAPTNITVHKGDTLNFDFRGFHTATLLPAGVGADDWRMDHQGKGGDFSLVQPDTDDSPPAFQFNKAALFPSDPSCGTPQQPCSYDGSALVNSGAPLNSQQFVVNINANPGTTFWVLCLIHSMMQMRVQVVPDNVATTTQTAINSYAAARLHQDHEDAAAAIPKLQKQTRHSIGNHRFAWDAYAGYDADGWGLDGMFPRTLHIKKGDIVRWHFGQLLGNIHTVTFPRSTAASLANNDFSGSNMKCEGANGHDTKPDVQGPPFCSNGGLGALEIEIRAIGVLPQGSHRYGGTGLHSSGVAGPDGLTTKPYDLQFTRTSSKSGFSYACAIHGTMMSGFVVVK
jgi:plastocyanin